ncbi:hypothetical protein ACUW8P_001401, partial [Corynebacterium afermentans]
PAQHYAAAEPAQHYAAAEPAQHYAAAEPAQHYAAAEPAQHGFVKLGLKQNLKPNTPAPPHPTVAEFYKTAP